MNPPRRMSAGRRRAHAVFVIAAGLVVLTACSLGSTAGAFKPSTANSPIARAGLADADGYIANGEALSAFDDEHAAVTSLDPALRQAIQTAAKDANRAGVTIKITAGWRSARYQQALLDDAIVKYGSEAEARKWVNTPEKSTHVTGDAVDVGPTNAASWLDQYGSDYGLCRVYANELWHFELLVTPGHRCPRMISDASGE